MTAVIDSTPKRPLEDVDANLADIVQEETQRRENQRSKRRRHDYYMTQYTQGATSLAASDRVVDETTPVTRLSNSEMISGYIKKITLVNFMCHEHFELNLNPRLNFVVGANGSGKSAILTAMVIGLGAKAQETNRGSSLKDLIRETCNSAKITIQLENGEKNSYKHEIFGSTIIIERTLRKEGTATFSVKNEDGREISKTRKDVQHIVDFFSISVSNPMCFLSQDNARSFLTASSSGDKYKQFMKGTLLDVIESNLNQSKENLNNSKEGMIKHKENIKSLEADYNDAIKILKEFETAEDLNKKKILLHGKSLWLDVKLNRNNCGKIVRDIEKKSKEALHIDEKINLKDEKIKRYQLEIETIRQELSEKESLHTSKSVEVKEVQDKLLQIRQKYENEKNKVTQLDTTISKTKSTISHIKTKIEQLKKQIEKEAGTDKDKMRNSLKEKETLEKKLYDDLTAYTTQIKDYENKKLKINHAQTQETTNGQLRIKRKIDEIQNINRGESNFMTNFHKDMPVLLKAIEKNKLHFKSLPIGPIGKYVTIKQEYKKWANSIQGFIGRTLNSFVFKNQSDISTFHKLAGQLRINTERITCYLYDIKDLDYSDGKANTDYKTIIDVLEFSYPSLDSLFVDQNAVEKVLLIEDMKTANSFLRTKPQNVSLALSLRNQKSCYFVSGGTRIDTHHYNNQPLQLKVGSSSEDNISYLNEQLEQEKREYREKLASFKDELGKVNSEINKIKQQRNVIRTEQETNSRDMLVLKKYLSRVVDTGSLDEKEEELKAQEEALQSYHNTISTIKSSMQDILAEGNPVHTEFTKVNNDLTMIQKELKELEKEENQRTVKISKYNDDIKYLKNKKDDLTTTSTKLKNNLDDLKPAVDKQIEKASSFCSEEDAENPDLPKTHAEIKRALEDIARQIRHKEESIGYTYEKAGEMYQKCVDSLFSAKEKYLEIEKFLSQLGDSIEARSQNNIITRRMTFLEADVDFRESLHKRKLAGNIEFDTAKRTLELMMATNNDKTSRDVNTLSGGEKSFSQIALLLATWKPIRSRIIALDEYDVYMDQVNRKVCTKLILNKLKANVRTQTVIITPQDISQMTDISDDTVSVHKMSDPERHANSNYYN